MSYGFTSLKKQKIVSTRTYNYERDVSYRIKITRRRSSWDSENWTPIIHTINQITNFNIYTHTLIDIGWMGSSETKIHEVLINKLENN